MLREFIDRTADAGAGPLFPSGLAASLDVRLQEAKWNRLDRNFPNRELSKAHHKLAFTHQPLAILCPYL